MKTQAVSVHFYVISDRCDFIILQNIFQVPLVLYSDLETAPREYIIFTRQLEERAQQMGPLLITTSTCSEGESGGLSFKLCNRLLVAQMKVTRSFIFLRLFVFLSFF